ncbi:MAG: hypothetical protein ABIR36_08740 [Nitrospiraceae bacterium]
MRRIRSLRDGELGVVISLAIVAGMVLGTVAAMWIWSAASKDVAAVMSLRRQEILQAPSRSEMGGNMLREEAENHGAAGGRLSGADGQWKEVHPR